MTQRDLTLLLVSCHCNKKYLNKNEKVLILAHKFRDLNPCSGFIFKPMASQTAWLRKSHFRPSRRMRKGERDEDTRDKDP